MLVDASRGSISVAAVVCGVAVASIACGHRAISPPEDESPQAAWAVRAIQSEQRDLTAMALQKAVAPDVRRFARNLDNEESTQRAALDRLLQQESITPVSGPASNDILKASNAAKGDLEPKNGLAFDRSYIQHEIDLCSDALNRLKLDFIPRTQNTALRESLETVMFPEVQTTLTGARKLRDLLDESPDE